MGKGSSGGQSTTSNTVHDIDYAYNDRIAAISEAQQMLAEEYADFWRTTLKPLDVAQAEADLSLVSDQTALRRSQLSAQQDLIAPELSLTENQLQTADTALTKMSEMAEVSVAERVAQAQAETTQLFDTAKGTATRDLQRMGYSAGSGAVRSAINEITAEKARTGATTATLAKRGAEQDTFNRLSQLSRVPGAASGAGASGGNA